MNPYNDFLDEFSEGAPWYPLAEEFMFYIDYFYMDITTKEQAGGTEITKAGKAGIWKNTANFIDCKTDNSEQNFKNYFPFIKGLLQPALAILRMATDGR